MMNAIELFHSSGKSAGVFYCEKCRRVAKDREFAEKCCVSRKCEDCGSDVPYEKHRSICDRCCQERRRLRIAERLEQASQVYNYDGWVYVEGVGYKDGYFESLGELLDYYADNGMDPPEFVFCCKASHFSVDYETVIEQAEQKIEIDCCPDYEPSYNGVKEFAEACKKFTEANRHVCTYFEDYTRKVRTR